MVFRLDRRDLGSVLFFVTVDSILSVSVSFSCSGRCLFSVIGFLW